MHTIRSVCASVSAGWADCVLAAGGSLHHAGVICTAAHGTRAHTSGAIALLGLIPGCQAARGPVYAAQPQSTVLRHDAQRLVQIREELPTHGLLARPERTHRSEYLCSLRAQLAVISRSVLDSGTPNDVQVPSGEWLSDANGSQTLAIHGLSVQNDRFRSCYTRVQWRFQFSEISRMEAMIAFGHFEAPNVASARQRNRIATALLPVDPVVTEAAVLLERPRQCSTAGRHSYSRLADCNSVVLRHAVSDSAMTR
jgi:hypothetical protein